MTNFEYLMESTVREMANPELPAEFEERMRARLSHGSATVHLATAELSSGQGILGVFASIGESIRELVLPQRLPPLALRSRPIAVVDSMAMDRSRRPMMGAVLAHAVVILVIGLVVEARVGVVRTPQPVGVVALDAPPPITPPRVTAAGGGGGQHGPTPVTEGHLPKFAEQQIVPPMPPPLLQPKIAIEPTVEVQKDLKMADNALPNLGIPNSPLVGTSLGGGNGSGIGPGNGNGYGPGSGGNAGGGLRQVGGGVSEPKILYQPDAEFSDEARKAKFSGDVLVYIQVDQHGNPTHIRVARSVGLGLDEKAIEAVRQYRFKPAMENGKPVTVELYVDVDFHIY